MAYEKVSHFYFLFRLSISETLRDDRPSSSSSSNHNNLPTILNDNDRQSASTNEQETEEQQIEQDGPSEPKIQKIEIHNNDELEEDLKVESTNSP